MSQQEIQQLKQENLQLRKENEDLKTSIVCLAAELDRIENNHNLSSHSNQSNQPQTSNMTFNGIYYGPNLNIFPIQNIQSNQQQSINIERSDDQLDEWSDLDGHSIGDESYQSIDREDSIAVNPPESDRESLDSDKENKIIYQTYRKKKKEFERRMWAALRKTKRETENLKYPTCLTNPRGRMPIPPMPAHMMREIDRLR